MADPKQARASGGSGRGQGAAVKRASGGTSKNGGTAKNAGTTKERQLGSRCLGPSGPDRRCPTPDRAAATPAPARTSKPAQDQATGRSGPRRGRQGTGRSRERQSRRRSRSVRRSGCSSPPSCSRSPVSAYRVYMTIEHFTVIRRWPAQPTGVVNCVKVTTSPESMIFGVFPVAVLGLAFYVFMVVVYDFPWAWRLDAALDRAGPARLGASSASGSSCTCLRGAFPGGRHLPSGAPACIHHVPAVRPGHVQHRGGPGRREGRHALTRSPRRSTNDAPAACLPCPGGHALRRIRTRPRPGQPGIPPRCSDGLSMNSEVQFSQGQAVSVPARG